VNCYSNSNNNPEHLKFYRFSSKNAEQRELWTQAVKRVGEDGKRWQPTKYSRICSKHFVGGKMKPTR
jgi:hypothetical protein